MSTISTGTSLTTAFVVTGDTSGELVIKTGTGAGTTAMTIDAAQNVAFANPVSFSGNIDANGNLNFIGTGQRITGDFSNATHSSRLLFQNSGANLPTVVGALPNGSSVTSAFVAYGGSTATDTATVSVVLNGGTDARISSGILGTGTYLPMTFYTSGSERMRLDTSGNLGIGTASPLQRFNAVNTSITGGAPATSGSAADPNAVARLQAGSVALDIGVYAAGQMWLQPRASTNYAVNYDLVLQPNGGNVGIGTASPASRLDVRTSAAEIGRFSSSAANGGYQIFYPDNVTTPVYVGSQKAILSTGNATDFAIVGTGANNMVFGTNSAERMRIDSSGKITDQYGNIRAIPQSGSDKTTSYTLATTDVGRFIGVGSGGSITVPNATFSTGDVVSIFNNTSGNVTLTMSITTAYIGGTDADKATITLATRGIATILFISGTVCVVNGNVT
jgi:hypothetical protein